MSHSYSHTLIHLIYSTKDRKDLITETMQPRLWKYLAKVGVNHGMRVYSVGGVANHVHLLFDLPATLNLAEAARIYKANSSRWLREQLQTFQWQKGYGGFSVSESSRAGVEKYIAGQAEHHKKAGFEQEFEALLKKHNVEYDPRWFLG